MPTFIAGLGIENRSRETAKLLVSAGLDTFEALADATVERTAEIHGLGPIKAEKIKTGIMSRFAEVARLKEAGVIPTRPKEGGPLAGLRFCFSGGSTRPWKELEQLVEGTGGDVALSVTKGVTHLVRADPSSASTKAQKAKKLGTEIISEEEFVRLAAVQDPIG